MSSPPLPRREPLWTAPFVLLSVAHFVQGLALHLYVHVPAFIKQLGAQEVEIGVIFSVTAAVAIAARPFVGKAMDRHGRRALLLAGGLLHVLACLLYFTVSTRGVWLATVRALHGLGEAMLFSALVTLAADIVPAARRAEGIALFGVSGLLPIAIAGILGDVALRAGGFSALFALSAGLAALALLFSLPVRDVPRPLLEQGQAPQGLWRTIADRTLTPIWFIGTVFALCLAAIFVFIKTYLLATRLGTVGEFLLAYILAACLLRVLFGWVPDRVGPKRALVPAILALSVGCLLLAFARTRTELLAAGVLSGLGHGFTFPTLAALVVTRAKPNARGAALSLYTATFDFGLLIGGPIFGGVVSLFGYPAMYVTASAVCALGALIYGLWER